ncbi:hypothetical protein HYDPIDRAFT_117556 [Hydnomerulius pinastri MD-312]|uniref:Uncharacterized protein n=1 Tax=Hydnomerulius pinastri MD-312 TaxID=994086 RepID=A0A0C9W2B4_9AGAM|nr:hypothetical protein HYDPIDRAFT_117556 [Hydnomerulius pinastri MD-312]
MLEAQKVIESVEAEAGEHLTTDTIARLRSKFYCVKDDSTPDEQFITAISSICLNLPAPGQE